MFTNLGEDGKPAFAPSVLSFRIKGRESNYASDAPDGVVLGQDGRYLVFQNGTSIFTYSLSEGYLYTVPFISSKDYQAENNSMSNSCYTASQRMTHILCGSAHLFHIT